MLVVKYKKICDYITDYFMDALPNDVRMGVYK
jgi:hypothetical protein